MTSIDMMVSPSPQRRILKYPNKMNSPLMSPSNRRRKDVGDYWLGKTLGKGSSGRVKMGIHKVTGEKVAIKIISKSHLASNASVEKAVKREIAVMKLISHPNIMTLIDVIDLSDSPNLYLVLEYVQGGELFEYLVSQGRLSEIEARKYFQQIIMGLDYCHRHLICHRDLKPENLLLDRDKNIKIADFGMASLQPTGSLLETSCGSPHYASPEIVNGIPYDGSASDIWSCGIILYALLSGHLPFDDDNIRQLLNKVKMGKYKIPDHLSHNAKDLIQKILVISPERRLTMKQVQTHPWFTVDPPPNLTKLPDPPTATEIGRPVASMSEIDERILETLKVLWTDLSTESMISALLNTEYNMQKVTYVLLQRHANSYWQTERDDDLSSVSSPAKRRRRPATICAVSSDKKEPFPGLNEMMVKLAEKEKTSSHPSPGIQQHHPSQVLSRVPINRLRPIIPPTEPLNDEPPPLPPKPIIIRTSFDIQPWPSTPVQQRRQTMWNSPLLNRPHAPPAQPVQQSESPQPQLFHYYMPTTMTHTPVFNPLIPQHSNINHMLSPRMPASNVLHHKNYHTTPSTVGVSDTKINRFMNIWSRHHKVENVDRHSLPSNKMTPTWDKKILESSSSAWKKEGPSAPPTPKLSSWLPGLFHFKQPKVCSLECEARDEREAIGKISQVVKEYMEGSIIERQDPDGRIRRKGEMRIFYNGKSILLRFKLEIYQLQTFEKRRTYRISFIQQQGDAIALTAAIRLVDQTLQTYEHEAEMVATANGWTTRVNIF